MDDAHYLHDTTDAAAWAKEFCKRWPWALCEIPGKEGVSGGDDFEAIMIGWFANAIMAGADSEARKYAPRIRELEGQIARFEAMSMLDFANYLTAKTIATIRALPVPADLGGAP